MKTQLTLLATAALVAASVTLSQAQPFNARGQFNDWGETPMNDDGDGTYSVTITGLTPGTTYEFKIAENDWTSSWPANNARVVADASGYITLHFRPEPTLDGWHPVAARVGYDDPGHGWEIMGSFNGWGGPVVTLTNSGSGLYQGAYVVPAAGTYQFKFRKAGDWNVQYGTEQFAGGGDLQATTTEADQSLTFRLDLPNGRWLAGDPLPASTNKVTFLVDMSVPIMEVSPTSGFDTNADLLYVRGTFNNWATQPEYQLFQVGGTSLYSNTVEIVAYAGTTIDYKFYGLAFPGEETPLLTCNASRSLTIDDAEVTAPLAYWSDRSPADPTNQITFQVDMSFQQALGNFDPTTDQVYLRGSFNNWGTFALTNKPAPETNVYAGVLELPNWPIGACIQYKFFNNRLGAPNGGWETINNRELNIASATQVLPVRPFNVVDPCSSLEETNFITFTVSMTNAVAVTPDATAYDGTQSVYLNGAFLGWWDWADPTAAADYVMTQVPGTSTYTITLPLPPTTPVRLQYKYSMNAADNEALPEQDHVRYIRTQPGQTHYTLPLDVWTGSDPERIANLQEPAFGNLTAVSLESGEVRIQWLGLKCVTLESTTDLTEPWTTHAATRGASETNWPAGDTQRFFRLVNPVE